jgi:hypothetical protein
MGPYTEISQRMDRPDQESALGSITLCNLRVFTKNLGIALEAVPDLVPGIRSKVGSRGVLLAVALVFEEVESAAGKGIFLVFPQRGATLIGNWNSVSRL